MATNTAPLGTPTNASPGEEQNAYTPGAISSGTPSASQNQPQPQGTGFVNLSQYLQANQGNQLGNTVASGLQGDINKVNQGLGTSQGQFNQAVGDINNQTNQYTGDVANTLGQFNTNYGNLNNQAQGYYTNPSDNSQYNPQNYANYASQVPTADYANKQLVDPNAYGTFANIRSDQYSGPQQLNNYNSLASQAQNAQNNAQNTQTAAGRQALLANYVNNPQYNAYQQGLDSIYLAQAQPQLSQAAQGARGLYNKVSGAETTAENQAQQAAQNISNLQGNTRNQLGGLQSGILNTLNNTAQADQTAQQQALSALQANLGTGKLTPEQLAATGLKSGTVVYNPNMSSLYGAYVNPSSTPNQQNVANVADLAGLQALQQLSGNGQPAFDLKQSGGYNPNNPYTFNTDAFNTAQQSGERAYQQALNTTNNPNFTPSSGGNQNVYSLLGNTANVGQEQASAQNQLGTDIQNLINSATHYQNNPNLSDYANQQSQQFQQQKLNNFEQASGMNQQQLQALLTGFGNPNAPLNDINTVNQLQKGFGKIGDNTGANISSVYGSQILPLLQQINSQYGANNVIT